MNKLIVILSCAWLCACGKAPQGPIDSDQATAQPQTIRMSKDACKTLSAFRDQDWMILTTGLTHFLINGVLTVDHNGQLEPEPGGVTTLDNICEFTIESGVVTRIAIKSPPKLTCGGQFEPPCSSYNPIFMGGQ